MLFGFCEHVLCATYVDIRRHCKNNSTKLKEKQNKTKKHLAKTYFGCTVRVNKLLVVK